MLTKIVTKTSVQDVASQSNGAKNAQKKFFKAIFSSLP